MLTSAAAAPALATLADGHRALPLHAIGAATAAAARQAGWARVRVGAEGQPPTEGHAPADGAALGRALASPGRRFLYPCAEARSPDLEAALEAGGASVTAWPVYCTVPRSDGAAALRALPAPPDAVLLHAPSAARALGRIAISDRAVASLLSRARMVCLSDRIAAALPPGVGAAHAVAARPDEAALLALLA